MSRACTILSLALTVAACAGTPRAQPHAAAIGTRVGLSSPPPEPPRGEAWTLVAPRDLPLPLGDVAAIDDAHAIVVARDALYRVDGDRFVRVCDQFDPPPTAVRADGDAFIAVGGGRASRASPMAPSAPGVAWFSRDRGVHCMRTLLPVLTIAAQSQGSFDAALDGNLALVWNDNGAIALSTDGAASWHRVADLPGMIAIARAGGDRLIAAAAHPRADALETSPASAAVTLYELESPHALAWRPLAIGAERRLPIALRGQPGGDVLLLDALGLARIAPDGTLRSSTPVPAFHAVEDRPSIIVSSGPDRFVLSTEYTVDVLDGHGLRPVIARHEHFPSALDASPSGAIWLADPRTLAHGSITAARVDALTHPPPLAGDVTLVASSGAHIALVGSLHSLARSDDAGEHWTPLPSPDRFRDAIAISVGARGEVLLAFRTLAGSTAVAVHDGDAWLPLDLPFPFGDQTPVMFIAGDRWIVAGTRIFTTDDQGQSWRARSIAPGDPDVRAIANHDGALLVLDRHGRMYRSNDGGSVFTALPESEALARSMVDPRGSAALAWDGAHRIAVATRTELLRSIDDGATMSSVTGVGAVTALVFAPRGELVVVVDARGSCSSDADGRMEVLTEARASRTIAPVRDACSHAASAISLDGTALVLASRAGRIESLDLSQIASVTPGL